MFSTGGLKCRQVVQASEQMLYSYGMDFPLFLELCAEDRRVESQVSRTVAVPALDEAAAVEAGARDAAVKLIESRTEKAEIGHVQPGVGDRRAEAVVRDVDV